MEDLNSFKEKLEANLENLSKFEGLESDLIQQHGNLRAQFTEYREVIEAANLSEKEKKEQFLQYDELLKRLHKLILEAKALARKRTEQMTRDELFKVSQERQKSLKPQSAEDKIGDEVTKSLKRMLETMRGEVERSSSNISTAKSTTKVLKGTAENYENLSETLDESSGLIRDLWRKNRMDMIYIFGALGVFLATAIWVILQRTPGVVWVPGKVLLRQLGNFIPKSVENIAHVAESILSDNEYEEPKMFIDSIEKESTDKIEEFGNDELLRQEEENVGEIKKEESIVEEQVVTKEPELVIISEDVTANGSSAAIYVNKTESGQSTSEAKPETIEREEPMIENEQQKQSNTETSIQLPTDESENEKVTTETEKKQQPAAETEKPELITETETQPEQQQEDDPVQEAKEQSQESVNASKVNEAPAEESYVPMHIGETPTASEVPNVTQPAEDVHDTMLFETAPATTEVSEVTSTTINNTIQPTEQVMNESINTVQSTEKAIVAEIADTPTVTLASSTLNPTHSPAVTASDSDGSQSQYSSEAELFSGSEEKMEL